MLAHEEVIDLGGRRDRYLDPPHVPHAWGSGLRFEETTRTLFTGDLFAQIGDGPAIAPLSIVDVAIATEEAFQATALTSRTAPTIRALKVLLPQRVAVMHGSWFEGDCVQELEKPAASN